MPLYSYRCAECGAETDAFNSVAECETSAPECHGRMQIAIQPVRSTMQKDLCYVCPATGEKVTSWRQRENIFKKHDLVDARDIKPDFVIRKQKERRAAREKLWRSMDMPDVDLTPYTPPPKAIPA